MKLRQKKEKNLSKNECKNLFILGRNFTRKGGSFDRPKKTCQDFGLARGLEGTKRKGGIIVACDGHGSQRHDRSEIGAYFGAVCVEKMAEFLCEFSGENEELCEYVLSKKFPQKIVTDWQEEIKKQEGEDADFVRYGTTLLFAIVVEDMLICGQLGDGGIALFSQNDWRARQIFFKQEKTSSHTESLCSPYAVEKMRVRVFDATAFDMVVLATDGVFDLFEEEDFLSFVEEIDEFASKEEGVLEEFASQALANIQENTTDDTTLCLLKLAPSVLHTEYNDWLLEGRISYDYLYPAYAGFCEGERACLFVECEDNCQEDIWVEDSCICYPKAEGGVFSLLPQGIPLQNTDSFAQAVQACQSLCRLLIRAEELGRRVDLVLSQIYQHEGNVWVFSLADTRSKKAGQSEDETVLVAHLVYKVLMGAKQSGDVAQQIAEFFAPIFAFECAVSLQNILEMLYNCGGGLK